MVPKFVESFMDMVCGVLNIVPPNPTYNVVQGENHIIENDCYDGWQNNFKGGFW